MDAELPDQPILTAADLLAYRRARGLVPAAEPPEAVILCYSRGLMAQTMRRHPNQRLAGFYGDVLLLKRTRGRVAVAGNFGLGAPVTAVLVEDLAAFGARRFVSVGQAGGLQPNLRPGDVVLADRAIRDEGTSRHYLLPAPEVSAALSLVQGLHQALSARNLLHVIGATWTTDAPYRELRRDAARHQAANVQTVEMEAAALFAVGQALGLSVGAALVVADTLAGGRWRLDVDMRPVEQRLEALFAVVLDHLAST